MSNEANISLINCEVDPVQRPQIGRLDGAYRRTAPSIDRLLHDPDPTEKITTRAESFRFRMPDPDTKVDISDLEDSLSDV